MDFQNMLQTPLDRSSIMERLGDIESYHWDHEQSEYYADYADLFNELALIAAGLYNDLERLIRKLDYADTLPTKRKMAGVEGYRGATWFNEAVSILEETDMSVLLEHEGVYDVDDIDRERGPPQPRHHGADQREHVLSLHRGLQLHRAVHPAVLGL